MQPKTPLNVAKTLDAPRRHPGNDTLCGINRPQLPTPQSSLSPTESLLQSKQHTGAVDSLTACYRTYWELVVVPSHLHPFISPFPHPSFTNTASWDPSSDRNGSAVAAKEDDTGARCGKAV
jgi:hypothetical protein